MNGTHVERAVDERGHERGHEMAHFHFHFSVITYSEEETFERGRNNMQILWEDFQTRSWFSHVRPLQESWLL
jgi:hypothetical protein